MSSEGTGYRRGSAHWRAGMSEPPLEFQQRRIPLLQSLLKAVSMPQGPRTCGVAEKTGQPHRLEPREYPTAHKQQLPPQTQANQTPPRSSPCDVIKTAVVLRVCSESCCNPERKTVHLDLGAFPPAIIQYMQLAEFKKNNLGLQ